MEDRFEAILPGWWEKERLIFHMEVRYTGEGPFHGLTFERTVPPLYTRASNLDRSGIMLPGLLSAEQCQLEILGQVEVINRGVRRIPPNAQFPDLAHLVTSALVEGLREYDCDKTRNLR